MELCFDYSSLSRITWKTEQRMKKKSYLGHFVFIQIERKDLKASSFPYISHQVLEKPTVTGIKPNSGSALQETEVWIKGRGFSEKNTDRKLDVHYRHNICVVIVTFGDKIARIT